MATKARVLNVRVTEAQRVAYERAAELEGTSVSALVTSATDARADAILSAHSSMRVPSEVFDALLASLDAPAPLAPSLDHALRNPRFVAR